MEERERTAAGPRDRRRRSIRRRFASVSPLKLAKANLVQQAGATTHPVRKKQIEAAIAENRSAPRRQFVGPDLQVRPARHLASAPAHFGRERQRRRGTSLRIQLQRPLDRAVQARRHAVASAQRRGRLAPCARITSLNEPRLNGRSPLSIS
jgi:hypothetical protein